MAKRGGWVGWEWERKRERERRGKRRCFWFSLGPIFLSFFSVLSGGSDLIPCKCNVAQARGGMGRYWLQGTHPLLKTERGRKRPKHTSNKSERATVFTRCLFWVVDVWANRYERCAFAHLLHCAHFAHNHANLNQGMMHLFDNECMHACVCVRAFVTDLWPAHRFAGAPVGHINCPIPLEPLGINGDTTWGSWTPSSYSASRKEGWIAIALTTSACTGWYANARICVHHSRTNAHKTRA